MRVPTSTNEGNLEESYYFIAACGIMCRDGEELPVGPGDAVMAPPGAGHGFRSTGEGPLKLIIS